MVDHIEITNKDNLRVVRTIRKRNRDDIYDLGVEIDKGNYIVPIKIEPNKDFITNRMLLKNIEDGSIVDVTSRRVYVQYGSIREYPSDEWKEILQYQNYQGSLENCYYEWAVYIVPKDAEKGEKFYIEDMIQDIVAEKFWGSIIRAKDGYATWNGSDLKIDESLYREDFLIG